MKTFYYYLYVFNVSDTQTRRTHAHIHTSYTHAHTHTHTHIYIYNLNHIYTYITSISYRKFSVTDFQTSEFEYFSLYLHCQNFKQWKLYRNFELRENPGNTTHLIRNHWPAALTFLGLVSSVYEPATTERRAETLLLNYWSTSRTSNAKFTSDAKRVAN